MKRKTLKIRSGHYDYQFNNTKHPYRTHQPVPFILLKGYWLERLNFHIGKAVTVNMKENQLVLTVAAP